MEMGGKEYGEGGNGLIVGVGSTWGARRHLS